MFRGGLIHHIPNNKLGLSRNKASIPPQASELVEYLQFDKNPFLTKNTYNIYGSFNYRLQNYPSDIDSSNTMHFNINDEEAAKIIKANIQKLVNKLVNNKLGRRYADLKAGAYPNGESIHWKPEEVMQGFRNPNIPDINGQSTDKRISLYDAILDKGCILKLDMIAPYFGRYVEVSCMYQISTKNGQLTHSNAEDTQENFLHNLAIDTGKQLKKGKLFKVIKRMYSNAKMRKDVKMLRTLEPLINSNISRLASIKADLSTLGLLLSNGHFPSAVVLKGEISKIKFNLDNILDIQLPLNLLYAQLDLLYKLLYNNDNKAEMLIENLEKELDNIINRETINYLKSIGINNFNQFGQNYIIN